MLEKCRTQIKMKNYQKFFLFFLEDLSKILRRKKKEFARFFFKRISKNFFVQFFAIFSKNEKPTKFYSSTVFDV